MAILKSIGQGLTGAITGNPIGTISGGLGIAQGISNWLTGAKKQENSNKEMANHSYELGEKAARNAYQRQKEIWELQNKYNSPENQRKLMEEAGLGVGLMYGSGTGAQGQGSFGNAPQGTGGTAQAINRAEIQAQSLNAMKVKSEIDVNESVAERNKAEAEKTSGVDTRLGEQQENINKLAEYKAEVEQNLHQLWRGALIKDSVRNAAHLIGEQLRSQVFINERYEYDRDFGEYGSQYMRQRRDLDIQRQTAEVAVAWATAEMKKAGIKVTDSLIEKMEAETNKITRDYNWTPAMNVAEIISKAAGSAAKIGGMLKGTGEIFSPETIGR